MEDAVRGVQEQVICAQKGALLLRDRSEEDRVAAIRGIARRLAEGHAAILEANRQDLARAKDAGLSEALIDRLTLTPSRLDGLVQAAADVAAMPPVVNVEVAAWQRPNGLKVVQKTVPLGVIAFIFESRPNVLVDAAVLAIKSGNSLIAKGGKEAEITNLLLGELIRQGMAPHWPSESFQVISARDRSAVETLLGMDHAIDLVIPRGGPGLIHFVKEHTRIPVIAHDKGLCHLYIHADADPAMAIAIALNAKVQRPGVCNAVETILVHGDWPRAATLDLVNALRSAGVEVRGDSRLKALVPEVAAATDEDWDTEYLDKIVSIKIVSSPEEATDHIARYGSHHTEAICARDPAVIDFFESKVDASMIAINASTRFNDGGELGIGPEIGISTSKLHSYGPMGARQLTATRYVVIGDGHCR